MCRAAPHALVSQLCKHRNHLICVGLVLLKLCDRPSILLRAGVSSFYYSSGEQRWYANSQRPSVLVSCPMRVWALSWYPQVRMNAMPCCSSNLVSPDAQKHGKFDVYCSIWSRISSSVAINILTVRAPCPNTLTGKPGNDDVHAAVDLILLPMNVTFVVLDPIPVTRSCGRPLG